MNSKLSEIDHLCHFCELTSICRVVVETDVSLKEHLGYCRAESIFLIFLFPLKELEAIAFLSKFLILFNILPQMASLPLELLVLPSISSLAAQYSLTVNVNMFRIIVLI